MEDPAVESMLLVAPNRSVDLEGLIDPLWGIDAVEFPMEVHRVVWKNFPIQLLPECLSASSATAITAALEGPLPPQSSIPMRLWALENRSGSCSRIGSLLM